MVDWLIGLGVGYIFLFGGGVREVLVRSGGGEVLELAIGAWVALGD